MKGSIKKIYTLAQRWLGKLEMRGEDKLLRWQEAPESISERIRSASASSSSPMIFPSSKCDEGCIHVCVPHPVWAPLILCGTPSINFVSLHVPIPISGVPASQSLSNHRHIEVFRRVVHPQSCLVAYDSSVEYLSLTIQISLWMCAVEGVWDKVSYSPSIRSDPCVTCLLGYYNERTVDSVGASRTGRTTSQSESLSSWKPVRY